MWAAHVAVALGAFGAGSIFRSPAARQPETRISWLYGALRGACVRRKSEIGLWPLAYHTLSGIEKKYDLQLYAGALSWCGSRN